MRFCALLSISGLVLGMSVCGTTCAELSEKPKELKTTRFVLHENQRATEPYNIRYDGKDFVVYPNVFSPKYFPDTYWFADHIRVQPGDSFLEIGSGTGLISVMAAIRGAGHVSAVDINPSAAQNTTENVFKHHVSHKFRIYEGDVFDPIPRGQKFDVIFWFAPFMHVAMDRNNLTDLEKSVFDPKYQSINKYLSQARNYLKPHGKLLLGFSPTHGSLDVLHQLAQKNGWSIRVVAREEEQIPWYPGIDQADYVTVMLIELNPAAPGVAGEIKVDLNNQKSSKGRFRRNNSVKSHYKRDTAQNQQGNSRTSSKFFP